MDEVYPNRSFLEMDKTSEVLQQIKERYVQSHLSYVYETICLQDLVRQSSTQLADYQLNRFGKWWNRHEAIDLVAISDETGSIAFGECKLTQQPMGADTLQRLRKKATQVKWGSEQRQECYVLYSFAGFSNTLQQIALADPGIKLFQ